MANISSINGNEIVDTAAIRNTYFCFNKGNSLSDLNNAPNNSVGWLHLGRTVELPDNMPVTSGFPTVSLLFTYLLKDGTAKIQRFVSMADSREWYRFYSDGSWQSWQTRAIDDNTASAYKTYSSSKIVSLIGSPIRNAGSIYAASGMPDLNDAPQNTIYMLNFARSTTELPANYPIDSVIDGFCMLATINAQGTSSNVQYFYSVSHQRLYTRWSYNNGGTWTWTPWTVVRQDGGGAGAYYTCMKDGSGDFSSVVQAINALADESNATLYIGAGTWDIISELGGDYVEGVSSNQRGLYLQNGIHVICSSRAKLTCNYTGDNANTREWLSLFNSGVGGFTLENAVLESSNIRYTVHDERGDATDHYDNVYINCKMTHNDGFYEQVIGGGLGIDGHVRIVGCVFDSNKENAGYLVSYHNSADGAWNPAVQTPEQARSFLEISNNYLKRGSVNIIKMGRSEEVTTVTISGNSLETPVLVNQSSTLYHYDNMEVLQWNNEIRS